MIDRIKYVIDNFYPHEKDRFFHVGDQFIFPIRSMTGGIFARVICYLHHANKDAHFVYPMEFAQTMSEERIREKLRVGFETNYANYRKVDWDGGDLGRE